MGFIPGQQISLTNLIQRIPGHFVNKPQILFCDRANLMHEINNVMNYSISSPIRHTCSVHVLSKILMRIYHIIVQTYISPQSKITEVHQNKKVINNMF